MFQAKVNQLRRFSTRNTRKESIFEDIDGAGGSKWEMALQPPTVEELQKNLGNTFNAKWIKYMYAHFKNECPTGKMRLPSFKNLLLPHLPAGISDDYIKRLFFAFSSGRCEVTFQALLETLAMLNTTSAVTYARWTMKLISGSDTRPVSYEEFANFVKSVFIRKDIDKRASRAPNCRLEEKLTLNKVIERRVKHRFTVLDKNEDGLIEIDELIDFFERDGSINVKRLTGHERGTCV